MLSINIYTIKAENIVVNAVYTAIEYTATFKADGVIVGTSADSEIINCYRDSNSEINASSERISGSSNMEQISSSKIVVALVLIWKQFGNLYQKIGIVIFGNFILTKIQF